MKVLLNHAGVDIQSVDAVFLAGGFGNYINPANAIKIGLIPEELGDRIIPIGNASGTGALLALKSIMFDDTIRSLLEKTSYIELSGLDDFNLEFAMNMDFQSPGANP